MKRTLLYIGIAIGLIFLGYTFGIFPIAINCPEEKAVNAEFIKGDTILPLESYLQRNGDYEMYVLYSLDDFYSNETLLDGKIFYSDDDQNIQKFISDFEFTYSGGDISTASSKLLIYCDNDLIFSSSLVLDKKQFGLQSTNYGWIENNNLVKYFKNFSKVRMPLIKL